MKILIFSDLHGNLKVFNLLMEKYFKTADQIWCLGDIFFSYNKDETSRQNSEQIMNSLMNYKEKTVEYYVGNCDGYDDYSKFKEYMIHEPFVIKDFDKLKICVTHGHLFEKEGQFKNLAFETKSRVIISGHTHIYSLKIIENTIYINPGSPAVPRDANSLATVVIFDTDKKSFSLKEIYTQDTIEEIFVN